MGEFIAAIYEAAAARMWAKPWGKPVVIGVPVLFGLLLLAAIIIGTSN